MTMPMARDSVVILTSTVFLALSFTHIVGLEQTLSNYDSGRVLTESNIITELRRRLNDATIRMDPLDNLKKYRGGYDVRNKHYWSSTAFTGIHGYAIAVIWLICGIVFLVITNTCCKPIKKMRSLGLKETFLQPIILLALLLTLVAVIACGLILGGGSGFHSRAKKITGVILRAAENASQTIRTTTGPMKEMDRNLTEAVSASAETIKFLTSTSKRLDAQADIIQRKAFENRPLIDDVLNLLYIMTEVTTSLILVLVIALLGKAKIIAILTRENAHLLSKENDTLFFFFLADRKDVLNTAFNVLRFQRTLQVVVSFCWIFTSLSWFFFGLYFSLPNFAGDACMAIEGFQMDPYNNSFTSILPCDELIFAESVLIELSEGIHNMVDKVNTNISASYGDIVRICNPFSLPPIYEYQPWNCSSTSKQIGDVPQVLRELACPYFKGEKCNGGIMIPASYYSTVEAYCSSIQKLVDAYPSMENLVQCRSVKDAFSEILDKHCRPLMRYLLTVWISFVLLSLVLVGLITVWIVGEHQWKNRHSSVDSHRHDPEVNSENS